METKIQEHEQEDKLSNLPDDILVCVLDKLNLLHDAVKTTVLSKRWRHLLGFRADIILDVSDWKPKDDNSKIFDELVRSNVSVVEATKSILALNSRRTINILSIKFYLRDESIDIVRSVDKTMANQKVLTAEFTIVPERLDINCTDSDVLAYGQRFMTSFDAYPCAFGGLTKLSLHSLRLGKSDIPNVLGTCKKLEHLRLENCDAGFRSILQIEHAQLAKLGIIFCAFTSVELKWLPKLTHLVCQDWPPSQDHYPLTLGYVPQLWVLILSSAGTTLHKTFELSEFLHNAAIGELDLNFLCERIWIKPEGPKRLAPLLKNLQFITLRFIHEDYDLTWTLFLLEASPLLNELNMQVSYHICYSDDEEDYIQIPPDIYHKAVDFFKWEMHHDFKHYNMRKLAIEGFQIEEKFTKYIRTVVKAAVNLELLSLLETQPCLRCRSIASTTYPRTQQEKDHIKKQISDWRSSPTRIEINF